MRHNEALSIAKHEYVCMFVSEYYLGRSDVARTTIVEQCKFKFRLIPPIFNILIPRIVVAVQPIFRYILNRIIRSFLFLHFQLIKGKQKMLTLSTTQ